MMFRENSIDLTPKPGASDIGYIVPILDLYSDVTECRFGVGRSRLHTNSERLLFGIYLC